VACIISGLEYIHNLGIVHRDIKPENLVFDERGYIKLADFGISRSIRDISDWDTSGTPNYMPPEAINRSKLGFGIDYYALGIICYEIILKKVIII